MTEALVSVQWLSERLSDPNIRIVDASYFVPGGIPPARQQYESGHIPGSVFFDINDIADTSKTKEHAFPSAETFAMRVGALGIGNQHHVIAYDHLGGACAAARAWFMFKSFGHDKVSVLDGGRTRWAAKEKGLSKYVPRHPPQMFRARTPENRIVTKEQVLANLESKEFQLADARSKGRYEGTEAEPRAGLKSGHIPASLSLPYSNIVDPVTKLWKDETGIRAAFEAAGVDLSKPLVTTCGSGVTACTVALGAYVVGKTDTAIYDGSWVEWGSDAALPMEKGTAKTP